jgi:hypothetical protein
MLTIPEAQKSFCTHPMELLSGKAQVEARVGPFSGGVSVGARMVHDLCQTYHRLKNRFGRTRWYP